MDDDEVDHKEVKKNGSKSFIKQQPSQSLSPNKLLTSKSKKLISTQETVEEIPEIETKKDELNFSLTNLPKLSFDNSSYSNSHFKENKQTKSYSEEEDDENPTDNVLSSPESKQSVIERNKINDINIINKETESIKNVSTNLLSKVILIDTLTSGERNGETINSKTEQTQNQVQINDTKIINNDSQTRRDFNDIEDYYRNYTNNNLDTLTKTNYINESNSLQRTDIIYEDNHKRKSYSNNDFDLKAILAITTELENRALESILKDIDKDSRNETKKKNNEINRKSDLISEKFKNIKSTGYGI
jgi:hypothetical protein